MAHTYGAVHCTKMRFDLISSADNLKIFISFRLQYLSQHFVPSTNQIAEPINEVQSKLNNWQQNL